MINNPRQEDIGVESNKIFVKIGKRCKHCNSKNIIKYGFQNDKQRYLCKDCKKRFDNNGHFVEMRNKIEVISIAIDLYFEGLSLRKVCRQLKKLYKVNVNPSTVYRWIKKYAPLVKNFVSSLKPNLSDLWFADETVIKVNGKIEWSWNIIDDKTRFLVSTQLTKVRRIIDAEKLAREGKEVAKKIPEVVVCDSLPAYRKGLRRGFGVYRRAKILGNIGLNGDVNNNRVERYHNTFKDRTRVMRGTQNPKYILDGLGVHYNYIRPHQSFDGQTPAEVAGINLPFNDGWGDLIRWSIFYESLSLT